MTGPPGTADATVVLGIDPGPTTGMCLAAWAPWHRVPVTSLAFECNIAGAGPLMIMILGTWGARLRGVQVEEFRQGSRSVRLRGASGAAIQAEIALLEGLATGQGIPVVRRPAAMVKPWADDGRLARAGLLDPTAGLTDARDAARHALYRAVKDLGLPDPLSKEIHR